MRSHFCWKLAEDQSPDSFPGGGETGDNLESQDGENVGDPSEVPERYSGKLQSQVHIQSFNITRKIHPIQTWRKVRNSSPVITNMSRLRKPQSNGQINILRGSNEMTELYQQKREEQLRISCHGTLWHGSKRWEVLSKRPDEPWNRWAQGLWKAIQRRQRKAGENHSFFRGILSPELKPCKNLGGNWMKRYLLQIRGSRPEAKKNPTGIQLELLEVFFFFFQILELNA